MKQFHLQLNSLYILNNRMVQEIVTTKCDRNIQTLMRKVIYASQT